MRTFVKPGGPWHASAPWYPGDMEKLMREPTRTPEVIVLTANGNDPLDEALAEEGKNEQGIYSVEEVFGTEDE